MGALEHPIIARADNASVKYGKNFICKHSYCAHKITEYFPMSIYPFRTVPDCAHTVHMDKVIQNNVELELSSGETVTLSKITLMHQAWLKEKYGEAEALNIALEKGDLVRMSEVAYRLMSNDDKAKFPAIKEEGFNDQGEKVEVFISGPMQFQNALATDEDLENLVVAMMKVLRMSNVLIESLQGRMKVVKKKRTEALKKLKLTGKSSQTPSTTSTDGPQKNSETEPFEKSNTASVK